MRPTLRRLAEQQIQIETLGEALDTIARQTGIDISAAKVNGTHRTRAFASRADRIPEGNVRSEDRAAFEAVASTRRRKQALLLGEMENATGGVTCPNIQCDNHGTQFVRDDLFGSDDSEAECPDCGAGLVDEDAEFERLKGLRPNLYGGGFSASRRRQAAPQRPTRRIRRRADVDNPANPIPEPAAKAPAVSQEEAESAQDTADVQSPYGEAASENVTPDATTDLLSNETVLDEPLDLDEDDVTVPVAGTTSNDSSNKVEYRIEGDPGNPHDDGPAFPLEGPFAEQAKVSSAEARTYASLRLARLRMEAGIEPEQDDLNLGRSISASKATDNEIAVEIKALEAATAASKRKASRDVPRNLVPREANATRSTPSMISGPASQPGSLPTMAVTDDEVLW